MYRVFTKGNWTLNMSREVRCCVWAGQGDVGLLRTQDVVTEGPGVAEAGLLLPEVPHHSLQLPVLQLVLGLESRDRVLKTSVNPDNLPHCPLHWPGPRWGTRSSPCWCWGRCWWCLARGSSRPCSHPPGKFSAPVAPNVITIDKFWSRFRKLSKSMICARKRAEIIDHICNHNMVAESNIIEPPENKSNYFWRANMRLISWHSSPLSGVYSRRIVGKWRRGWDWEGWSSWRGERCRGQDRGLRPGCSQPHWPHFKRYHLLSHFIGDTIPTLFRSPRSSSWGCLAPPVSSWSGSSECSAQIQDSSLSPREERGGI